MAGPRYAADPRNCRVAELGGLTALFHLPSGMTHIVAPPVPEILEALRGGPADAVTILARMSERFEIADAEEGLAAVGARLAELEAAGLVSRT